MTGGCDQDTGVFHITPVRSFMQCHSCIWETSKGYCTGGFDVSQREKDSLDGHNSPMIVSKLIRGMEGEGEVNLESDELLPSEEEEDVKWESINEEDSPE